jgi:hypothetical protein
MRSRASEEREMEGEGSTDVSDVCRRNTRRRSLISFKYRKHQTQTNRWSLNLTRSRMLKDRSRDSDINGTIALHGCCLRNSQNLTSLFVFV